MTQQNITFQHGKQYDLGNGIIGTYLGKNGIAFCFDTIYGRHCVSEAVAMQYRILKG